VFLPPPIKQPEYKGTKEPKDNSDSWKEELQQFLAKQRAQGAPKDDDYSKAEQFLKQLLKEKQSQDGYGSPKQPSYGQYEEPKYPKSDYDNPSKGDYEPQYGDKPKGDYGYEKPSKGGYDDKRSKVDYGYEKPSKVDYGYEKPSKGAYDQQPGDYYPPHQQYEEKKAPEPVYGGKKVRPTMPCVSLQCIDRPAIGHRVDIWCIMTAIGAGCYVSFAAGPT